MHAQLNRLLAMTIAATMALGMSMGVEAYARPADTMTGEAYRAEAMLVTPDALDNDWHVMDTIPATTGGRIGTIGASLSAPVMAALQACIDTYTQEDREVSFVMMDLCSGRTIYYNTAFEVYSASCIKGPYIISCLMAGNDATNDMYLAGHYSDNEAYHRIRDTYGSALFARWLRKAGVRPTLAAYYYCHLTALDLTRMWLATYPYLIGDEAGSSSARQILQDSKSSAIELRLSSTHTVYSKAGWIADGVIADYNAYNVGGIVMGEYPYLLIITSNARSTTTEAEELVTALEAAHDEIIAQLAAGQTAGAAADDTATQETTETPAANLLTDPIPAPATDDTKAPSLLQWSTYETRVNPGGE